MLAAAAEVYPVIGTSLCQVADDREDSCIARSWSALLAGTPCWTACWTSTPLMPTLPATARWRDGYQDSLGNGLGTATSFQPHPPGQGESVVTRFCSRPARGCTWGTAGP